MQKSDDKNAIKKIAVEKIINQLPGHVYWKAKNGTLLGCNKKTLETFGLSSLKDYVGKTDYDLLPKNQADKIRKIDKEVIRTGKTILTEEEGNVGSGSTVLYLSYKTPLKTEKGKIIGISGVSLDVTKIRKNEMKRFHLLENIIALIPGHVYWKSKNGKYLGCNNEQATSLGLKLIKNLMKIFPQEKHVY